MRKVEDFFNQDFVTFLMDKAVAKHSLQSAGEVTSSWELVEQHLLYFGLKDEYEDWFWGTTEEKLGEWEVYEELQDRLPKKSYHSRTWEQMKHMAKGLLYRAMEPEVAKIEALKKMQRHLHQALRKAKELKQRTLEEYLRAKFNFDYRRKRELWKKYTLLRDKVVPRIEDKIKKLKTLLEKLEEEKEKKWNEVEEFLNTYLEVLFETAKPADWKIFNKWREKVYG